MDNINDSEREIRAAMDRLNEKEKEIRITDEFFKTPPDHWETKGSREDNGFTSKLKNVLSILTPIMFVVIIVLSVAAVFMWKDIGTLQTSIKTLNSKINSIDTAGLKSQLVVLETKVEHMAKENEKLRNEIAQIHNDIDALKAKREKAEAQRQAVTKKKTPAPPQQKQR
ncbi:MAG: hypothetical protein N2745_02950 [Syntrophorhabdaceae bacterium]|nr:hypothetical protein [Syntrophorhabdaceae bacterium]